MPSIPEPHRDPLFRAYFARGWSDAFAASLRNFLATVFSTAPPPALLLLQKWHRAPAQAALRAALEKSDAAAAAAADAAARARGSRDALAALVRDLVAHARAETLRDGASRATRGGLFDDDDHPRDALAAVAAAGADALESARRLAPRTGPPADDGGSRDADLRALCDKARAFLDLTRGASSPAAATGGAI